MSWRLARSLVGLRLEADTVAPRRSHTGDGTIGNTAHAARASRHNPNAAGVVCALDLTHDPANGLDTYSLFDWLRTHPHPCLEYVISNRRIASRGRGWTSRPYTGASPHDHHIHIAVGRGLERNAQPPYDDAATWGLSTWRFGAEEEDEMTEEERTRLNKGRVSDIKQSYNIAILEAKADAIADVCGVTWPAKVADLLAQRDHDVAAEKARLGL